MHGSMRRVRQKFAETEMNRHFGKTLATQDAHIHQTTISFTYTPNHHKLHIYTSHIHQNHHKLHIYIKPPQASHIHFTYTSNHHKLHIYIKPKLHIYIKPKLHIYNKSKLIKASIWVI